MQMFDHACYKSLFFKQSSNFQWVILYSQWCVKLRTFLFRDKHVLFALCWNYGEYFIKLEENIVFFSWNVVGFQYMSPALPPKKSPKPRLERGKNVKGMTYETAHVNVRSYDDLHTRHHSHYKVQQHHHSHAMSHHKPLSAQHSDPIIQQRRAHCGGHQLHEPVRRASDAYHYRQSYGHEVTLITAVEDACIPWLLLLRMPVSHDYWCWGCLYPIIAGVEDACIQWLLVLRMPVSHDWWCWGCLYPMIAGVENACMPWLLVISVLLLWEKYLEYRVWNYFNLHEVEM